MRPICVPSQQFAFVTVDTVGLGAPCVNPPDCRPVEDVGRGGGFYLFCLLVFIAFGRLLADQ